MPAMPVGLCGASRRDEAPGQDLRVKPKRRAKTARLLRYFLLRNTFDRVIFISSLSVVSPVWNDRNESREESFAIHLIEKNRGHGVTINTVKVMHRNGFAEILK